MATDGFDSLRCSPSCPSAARSTANSDAAFEKARRVMPGGVSSPVRAFKGVGGTPVFIKEGEGCIVTDVDGNDVHRLRRQLRPADRRARQRARGRGAVQGDRPGDELRHARPKPRRTSHGRDRRRLPSVGDGAVRQQRHRGDDERHPPGPGRDRARHRSSSASAAITATPTGCSSQAGSGALTLGTPSSPGVPQVDHRDHGRSSITTTSTMPWRSSRNTPGRSPASSSSRSRGTWAWSRRRRDTWRGCGRCATQHGALLHLRRSDDRLPRRLGRGAGRATTSSPT